MKFKILMCLLFIENLLSAQTLPIWVSTYGSNPLIEYYNQGITVDNLGNVYVTGYGRDTSYRTVGVTIKYNSWGIQQWADTLSQARGWLRIAVDKLNNIYVIGQTRDSIGYLTVKYDPGGNILWSAIYNSPSNMWDTPFAIKIDDSLNVYVTGEGGNTTIHGSDWNYLTIKYDSAGVQQWVAQFAGADIDRAYALDIDSQHNIYVTGQSFDTLGMILTVKYDINGVEQWTRRYNGPNYYENGAFIKVYNDTSVYVGGSIGGPGWSDFVCIKYDITGNEIWSAVYDAQLNYPWGNAADVPHDMKVDNQGNVYMTGDQFQSTQFDAYCTIKFNPDGLFQWVKSYKGSIDWNHAYSMALDNYGNVFVTGFGGDSVLGTYRSIITIKYDSSGNTLTLLKYAQSLQTNYDFETLVLDSIGNIYISAMGLNQNSYDIVTLKYGYTTGEFESSGINENLLIISPNPFHTSLTISFPFQNIKQVIFTIRNVLGQTVYQTKENNFNRQLKTLDLSLITNGIYLLEINMDGNRLIKKIVKE